MRMEDHPGVFTLFLFVWSEIFASLLFLFGAPTIVWMPVALFIPVIAVAAGIKVTYDLWKERRRK